MKHKKVLNSKLEYNRTIIPDIEEEGPTPEEIEKEESVDRKIEELKRTRMGRKKRRNEWNNNLEIEAEPKRRRTNLI